MAGPFSCAPMALRRHAMEFPRAARNRDLEMRIRATI
jgi:hypothetical protein